MRKLLPLLVVCLSTALATLSQTCPTGHTKASLNWDNLDFLVQDPTYISASQAQIQYFAFGTNKVTITHNYEMVNTKGDNVTNTGETGSFGTGADVQFIGNGTLTVTFQTAVQNVKFSLYDVDYAQRVTISAADGATAKNVTLTKISGTQLSIVSNGVPNASAKAADGTKTITDVANTATDGTLNVEIPGSLTYFTITVTESQAEKGANGESGSFWLSDIEACNPNTVLFPSNYYAVSQPFPNQPGYVLSAVDNTVLMINPANGVSKVLFADPSGQNINSMAYDAYNKMLYYTYSLTNAGKVNPNNKSIQRYNVATGEITTIVSNVNTLGIPTYGSGVESGGAAFYDGALYLGIEAINGDESKIWRIDFDAALIPLVPARQVFGVATDEHDWSDFAISDGILYDFDGKKDQFQNRLDNIYHVDLQTGATTATYTPTELTFIPRQVAVDWTGKMYNTGTAQTTAVGTIVPYSNGTINTAQEYTLTVGTTQPSGSWGDAAEAFKAMADFGDAPSSYEDPLAPALHEKDPNLTLGSSADYQWDLPSAPGMLADQDGLDNGLDYVTILNNSGSYQTYVNVFNNTGADATLCAWIDYNANDMFDEGEGISVNVPTSASMQKVDLYWNNTGVSLPSNSYTYLRIRLTSALNGMTTAKPMGFFSNGEVEDYRVLVTYTTLDVRLAGFEARRISEDKVKLSWSVTEEEAGTVYELQKSDNQQNWTLVKTMVSTTQRLKATYDAIDEKTIQGDNYYRLKITEADGKVQYSHIRKVHIENDASIQLSPNPASNAIQISVQSVGRSLAIFRMVDMNGTVVYSSAHTLEKGLNRVQVPVAQLMAGVYQAELWIGTQKHTKPILIRK